MIHRLEHPFRAWIVGWVTFGLLGVLIAGFGVGYLELVMTGLVAVAVGIRVGGPRRGRTPARSTSD